MLNTKRPSLEHKPMDKHMYTRIHVSLQVNDDCYIIRIADYLSVFDCCTIDLPFIIDNGEDSAEWEWEWQTEHNYFRTSVRSHAPYVHAYKNRPHTALSHHSWIHHDMCHRCVYHMCVCVFKRSLAFTLSI